MEPPIVWYLTATDILVALGVFLVLLSLIIIW
jgi:hypothetical protein